MKHRLNLIVVKQQCPKCKHGRAHKNLKNDKYKCTLCKHSYEVKTTINNEEKENEDTNI